MVLSARETAEVAAANEAGRQPVVFVHGLWLLAGSWDPWRTLFDERGYSTVAADWPGDAASVAEARARPDTVAGVAVGDVTDHVAEVIGGLSRKPAVIGHSFGGLITQRIAGMGRSAASVAIDPAPFRGVLPLPISSLRAAFPVLRNPLNRKKAIALTAEQFRYAFTNAVSEEEAAELYATFPVPGSGMPLFQAAAANLNWRTEAKVDTKQPARGPLLIISGELDHTVPWSIANAAYKRQRKNPANTEITEIPGRGHSLTIDSGWREVADVALAFLERTEVIGA